jgi:hypothetical protein
MRRYLTYPPPKEKTLGQLPPPRLYPHILGATAIDIALRLRNVGGFGAMKLVVGVSN